jgi:hypothetical protein
VQHIGCGAPIAGRPKVSPTAHRKEPSFSSIASAASACRG